MAKKKKGEIDSLMGILDDMIGGLSPDQQMNLMDKMLDMVASGRSIQDAQNDNYTYQRPDYTKDVKPLVECLLPLVDAAKPSEALAVYENIHDEMAKASPQEQEDMMRNFFMHILADGLTRDFKSEQEKSNMPLFVAFQLVDDFKLIGLFDVILETMKQDVYFFDFYYGQFEDAATLILAHVGVGHMEELKEVMKTDGFVSELYPIVFNAVVQMAVENPFCRLQVLAWVSDVLKSCIEFTIPAIAMDWTVKSLAQIKAVDLLPLFKDIYKEYNVPSVEIKNGIKGVTKLLSNGTDERIVDFLSFKELLEQLVEGEKYDFDTDDDIWEEDEDDEEWSWADEERQREADALFYKELYKGSSKTKSKAKSGKNSKKQYAYTLDVALKGSPRKVYRQLVVSSNMTLADLGEILVCAVGWDGCHLNQFIDGKESYSVPEESGWGIDDDNDAREYTIGQILRRLKAKVKWEYDFGDSWIHEITLVDKQEVAADAVVKVQLVKATGACPPEDCGGVGGYRYLLNALKNPGSGEYEEMVDWLGGGFDPKSFNIVGARQRIAGYMKGKGDLPF